MKQWLIAFYCLPLKALVTKHNQLGTLVWNIIEKQEVKVNSFKEDKKNISIMKMYSFLNCSTRKNKVMRFKIMQSQRIVERNTLTGQSTSQRRRHLQWVKKTLICEENWGSIGVRGNTLTAFWIRLFNRYMTLIHIKLWKIKFRWYTSTLPDLPLITIYVKCYIPFLKTICPIDSEKDKKFKIETHIKHWLVTVSNMSHACRTGKSIKNWCIERLS